MYMSYTCCSDLTHLYNLSTHTAASCTLADFVLAASQIFKLAAVAASISRGTEYD